ncbi:MAG: hypothetical protein JXR52_08690 [Bacteroidales bacterium]|nr:hypothetical protein [Bacteroidales bacterium]MBN2698889.1 hypothetical protein [Bacteroidales bacterium]
MYAVVPGVQLSPRGHRKNASARYSVNGVHFTSCEALLNAFEPAAVYIQSPQLPSMAAVDVQTAPAWEGYHPDSQPIEGKVPFGGELSKPPFVRRF